MNLNDAEAMTLYVESVRDALDIARILTDSFYTVEVGPGNGQTKGWAVKIWNERRTGESKSRTQEQSNDWLMQLYTDEIVKMEHCAYIGDKAGEQRHKETAERLQWAIDYAEGASNETNLHAKK